MDLSTSSNDPKDGYQIGLTMYEILKKCKKPIICKINGPCLGGGVGLVFTTDIRITSIHSYFSLTEVKRGLIPAIISLYIVPELGPFKSNYLMLTGDKISAQEAFKMGFINYVADPADLDLITNKYIQSLLESAPKAMAIIKDLVTTIAAEPSREKHVNKIKTIFENMMVSDEAIYGINCFLQKKKVNWNSLNSKL